MTQITATVSAQPITASVSGSGNISASVGSSVVTASAGGGIGPQGQQGIQGQQGVAGTALGSASDVQLSGLSEGDLLRYGGGKWQNYPENNLVIDGTNF
jgi:hypothetical protein